MKKWIGCLLMIIILTICSIYIFIPAKIVISRIITSTVSINGEYRNIRAEEQWEKWWRDAGGQPHSKGEPFKFRGSVYSISKIDHNAVGIEMENDGEKIQTIMHLVSFKLDSTGTIWECEVPAGNNLLNRIWAYKKAQEIRKNMDGILRNLSSFLSFPKNIYQLSIFKTSIHDTTMLSGKFTSATYPTIPEIYGYFEVINKSILKQKGKSTGYPLVYVRMVDSGQFETQVALPTSHILKNDGELFYRRMVPGNFLCTEVRGGTFNVSEGMKQLEFFLRDNNKTIMAIPFEQWITNRIQVPDSSKWLTRIYIPVVE